MPATGAARYCAAPSAAARTAAATTWTATSHYLFTARFDPHDRTGLHAVGYAPYQSDPGLMESRDGGVTLPTTGQAQYTGNYSGLRDFDGRGADCHLKRLYGRDARIVGGYNPNRSGQPWPR